MADLQGRTLAFLEARRATELADLIRRHHGVPLAAPCLREHHAADAPALAAAVARLCEPDVTVAIFLTGVGVTTILDSAHASGREADLQLALAQKRVVTRGPKPVAVLRKAGVRIDLQAPPPHTSAELLAALAAWELTGQTVAVQLHGGPADELLDGLRARGATVVTLAPYRWERPVDTGPIERLIASLAAGAVDALLVTSAAQVETLFAIADEIGQVATLRRALARLPVAAQGPVCAAALSQAGVAVALQPPTGHMGALVLAVAAHLAPPTTGMPTPNQPASTAMSGTAQGGARA